MSHTLIYNLIYALIRFQKITLMYSKHINDIFPPGFCAPGYHNCHSAATCAPTANSFTCTCNQDFQGDGTNCTRKFLPVTKLLFIYFWSKDQCTLKLSSCSVWKTLVLWTTDNYLLAFSHDFFFCHSLIHELVIHVHVINFSHTELYIGSVGLGCCDVWVSECVFTQSEKVNKNCILLLYVHVLTHLIICLYFYCRYVWFGLLCIRVLYQVA